MKGQIWSMDFIASIIIMISVLVPALFIWNNIRMDNYSHTEISQTSKKAVTIIDNMLESPGVPSGWNNSSVITVGFCEKKGIIDPIKLDEFNKTSYHKLKTIFGSDFYFRLEDINKSIYLEKGKYPFDNESIMPVQRRGLYKGRIVILDLLLHYQ